MARFDIISKDGDSVRYSGKPRYNGAYLRPSYIEFSEIASPAPISWEVGDYLDYPRTGMRYRLYSIPQASKNARKDSHGRAFTYSNVQMHAATKELEIAPFRDLVSNDNSTHFSTSPDVATFEDVYGIARRIQACMDNLYPGRWEIRVADFDATDDADIIEKITTAKEFALSGGTCLDALSRIYELWQDVGWVHTYEADKEVIIIGYPNKRVDENTSDAFLYGKGNGLAAIKKNQTNKEEFATRLYVYGSERNLPARYYNGKDILNAESVDIRNLMLPIDSWGKTDGIPDARKAYIENVEAVSKYGVIPKTHYFDSEDAGGEIYPSISKITIGQIRSALSALGETQYLPNQTLYPVDGERVDKIKIGSLISDNGVINPTGQTYEQTKSVLFSEDIRTTVIPSGSSSEVTFQEEVMINDLSFDGHPYGEVTLESENISFSIEDSSVKSAIATFVLSDMYSTTIKKTQIVVAKQDGDVWSISFPKLSLSFDQSERHNFPIVLSVSVSVTPKESSISNRTITLTRTSGVIKAGFNTILIKTFTIYLKQIGFDINERASQGNDKAITMKSGSCKGRSFIISNSRYKESTDTWELTCKRQQDDTLGLMFPNKDYQIAAGDEFAILGISMPELYVLANSQRLLSEGKRLLARASTIQNLYEPSIDAKVMAESGRVLREGMFMKIKDEDIVDNTIDFILIDTLSIYEDEGAIPTYKVTLRERRKVTYKGTPSVTSPTETQPVEESKSSSDMNLSGYATEEYVNKRVSNAEKDIEDLATHLSSMWFLDDDGNVRTKHNVVIEGDTSSGGEGEDTPSAGLDEEQLQAYLDEHRYVTEDDVAGLIPDVDLTGYATEEYVRNQIAGIDLSPYATKTDVSTAIANLINGAPTTLDTLKEIADALAENEDVVEALEAAIGTKANASDVYTKAQIDAEFEDYETALATKAAKSDLTALQRKHDVLQDDFDVLESTVNSLKGTVSSHTTNIGTLQGYFSNGIAKKATADASGNVITSYYTPIATHNALATRVGAAETNITSLTKNKADKATTLAGYGITNAYTKTEIDTKVTTVNNTISGVSGRVTTLETWKSDISKYITIVDGNVKISTNLIVTGDTSSGGSGEDTGAEGTVTGVLVGTTKYESVSAGLLDLTSLMALYTPVSTHNNLVGRVTALEDKATAVSFTQTLTSGTKIGTITIDGVGKNIYTPTIPTAIKNPHALSWSGYSSGSYDGSAAKSITIPSNTNQLTNGAGFITGIAKSMVDSVLGGTASSNTNKFLMCTGSTTVWSAVTKSMVATALGASTGGRYLIDTGGDVSWSAIPTKLSQFTDDVVSGNYLPLTGGTLANSTWGATLILKGNNTSAGLQFYNNGTFSGLMYSNDEGPVWYRASDKVYPIIHSGNIEGQSVSHATTTNRFKVLLESTSGDLNTALAAGGVARNYNGGLSQYTNAPSGASFGMVLELRGSTASSLAGQLAWDINHGSTSDVTRYLWWRASDSPNGFKYGKWHQIAFTDSNVASATKLQTARTIWGQSFDGTGNVDGNLSLGDGKKIYWHGDSTNYCIGTSYTVIKTAPNIDYYGYGGHRFITAGKEVLRINNSGNVTIGGSDLAGTSAKLYVDGTVRFGTGSGCDVWLNRTSGNSYINAVDSVAITTGNNSGNVAFELYANKSAKFFGAVTMSSTLSVVSSITTDGNLLTKGDLILNSSTSNAYTGGIVHFGYYGVDLRTDFSTSFKTSMFGNADDGAKFRVARTDVTVTNLCRIYGNALAWASGDTNGYLAVSYESNASEAFIGGGNADKLNWSAKLFHNKMSLVPNANSSYTLGTSSYRWSTIYGTHGNFSASVTATTSVVTPLLQASGGLDIVANGSAAGSRLFLTSNCFRPWGDDSKLIDLGSSSIQWRNLYAVGATFSGDVTINGNLIVKGDTSSGGTAEDTSGNGETMKVFSEALIQAVNGTTKELENGMYSYRITAAVGLNFLNVKPADTSKPCVIHLVKGGSYSLTIPVESTSGCVVTSAAGAKSTTPTVIPQYKGVTLVWDTYNEVWNVVYHGLI